MACVLLGIDSEPALLSLTHRPIVLSKVHYITQERLQRRIVNFFVPYLRRGQQPDRKALGSDQCNPAGRKRQEKKTPTCTYSWK